MQKTFEHITPQKKTLSIHSFHEDNLLKDLSPLITTIGSSNLGRVKL